MSRRRIRCRFGKSCSKSCIRRKYVCRKEFPKDTDSSVSRIRGFLRKESASIADHIGKNVAAWKAGKVLGQAVSAYLESQYGISRELSSRLSETVVQGLVATGLDSANLKSGGELMKKLLIETTAAFIGKSSHTGVERFVSAKEVNSMIETALPAIAGKVSGFGVAAVAGKIPSPAEIGSLIRKRSAQDVDKLKRFISPLASNFGELEDVSSLLGDLSVLLAIALRGKISRANS